MTEKLRLGATPFPFKPSGGASLACTGSTGSVALAGTGEQVLVTNAGSAAVYIEMGASAVTATTAGLPVLPGTQVLLTIPESSAGYARNASCRHHRRQFRDYQSLHRMGAVTC